MCSTPSQGQGGINIDGHWVLAIRTSVIEESCQKNEKGPASSVIVGTATAELEPDAMKDDGPRILFFLIAYGILAYRFILTHNNNGRSGSKYCQST